MPEQTTSLEAEWGERMAKAEVRVSYLEAYQKVQNGRLVNMEKKLDRIQQQLIGMLSMLVVSLVLLVVNIVT